MSDEQETPAAQAATPTQVPALEPTALEPTEPTAPPRLPIFGGKAAFGLAAFGAVLAAMAFAGIGYWPLTFVAWVPMILAVRGQTPRRALALGALGGFIEVSIGFYWLTPMLQTFSGFPLPLCVLFAAILSAYQGGSIALMTWSYARAERRGWNPDIAFLGAFALSELAYPLLFPWYFGASFHDQPLLMQTAELGGPILVSLIFVGFNLGVAALVRRRLFRGARHPGTASPSRARDNWTVGLGFGVTLAAIVFGDVRMRQIDQLIAQSQPVKIGLVQSNIGLTERRAALPESLRLTKLAKEKGAELVVWSEATIPQPFDSKNYAASVGSAVGKRLGLPGVVGGVLYERIPTANATGGRLAKYFNSAFLVDEKGDVTGRYDKQFLLMFGEYLPLGEMFPILYQWSPNSGAFTSGTSFEPLRLGEHRLATMICYEDIIPSFVNKLVRTGNPDLLVNLTNDRWFQNPNAGNPGERDTNEPIQHLALAKLRSIEHRMYLARVSNSGLSALIDSNGRVVVQTQAMRPDVVVGEARYMRVPTLYSLIGDYPWWVVSALTVAAGFIQAKRTKRAVSGAQA